MEWEEVGGVKASPPTPLRFPTCDIKNLLLFLDPLVAERGVFLFLYSLPHLEGSLWVSGSCRRFVGDFAPATNLQSHDILTGCG